ncbi:MAG: hypothetical protein PHQ74_05865 [Crocinitomicaceae bacterium]|nr:hypothetical protein [Crocinitomicaceae bacterium]
MTKKLLLFLLFISSYSVSFAQLKKAAYGIYEGKIENYSIGELNEDVAIDATNIEIHLFKDYIFLFIGGQKYVGNWKVLLETKVYYLVEALTNSEAPERLMVYKKERKIIREGISPQPNAVLMKKRK